MGDVERAGDLAEEVDAWSGASGAVVEPRLKVGALDVAHGDEEDAVDLAGLVDRQDVRVVDGRRHLRLALESRAEVGIVRQLGRQDLEGDLAAEAGCSAR